MEFDAHAFQFCTCNFMGMLFCVVGVNLCERSSFSLELEVHLSKKSKVTASPVKMSLENAEVLVPSTKMVKVVDIAVLKVRRTGCGVGVQGCSSR